jgi:hypothetical protein
MKREGFGLKGITDSGKDIYLKSNNPPTKQGAAWEDSSKVTLRI